MTDPGQQPDINNGENGYDEPEVERGVSSVATAQGKSIAILAIIGVVTLFVLYNILFTDETPPPTAEEQEQQKKGPKQEGASLGPINLPGATAPSKETLDSAEAPPEPEPVSSSFSLPTEIVLPDPPKIVAPAPPPPPPTPAATPSLPSPSGPASPGLAKVLVGENAGSDGGNENANGQNQQVVTEQDLKNAGSLVYGGGEGGAGFASIFGGGKDSKSGTAALAEIPESSAEKATATRIKDLSLTIAQGKMIEAVLETPINTDLPGLLRAIVSNNVYSEQGRNILLPKGSRIIGNYESSVERGQKRVYIIWGRVIRPDGIDITIDSPGTDQLGRAGVEGLVDNKYLEIFGSSILVSAITTTAAILGEQLSDSDGISQTENTDGSSNTSGTVSDFAIADAVTEVGDIGSELVDELMSSEPTITVNQGTRIKVFVNKDLVFPPITTNGVTFIQ